MKNWLKSLTVMAAVALVILPCVLFSACSNNNADHNPGKGDTYVYGSFVWGEGATDEMKEMMSSIAEAMENTKIEFISNDEAKVTMGEENQTMKYAVKDGKVTIGEGDSAQTFVIKGKTLVMEYKQGDSVIYSVTYKLQ